MRRDCAVLYRGACLPVHVEDRAWAAALDGIDAGRRQPFGALAAQAGACGRRSEGREARQ